MTRDDFGGVWKESTQGNTTFYSTFARDAIAKQRRTTGKAKSKGAEREVFQVGDTILVETMPGRSSVGVIVSMWGVELVQEEESDREEQEKERALDEQSQMYIKVHWFLQPSELPRHRAQRDRLRVSTSQKTYLLYLTKHT
jgi:origin recognition complex subunit 1